MLFNAQSRTHARLTVIRLQGYQRSGGHDETALPPVEPPQNLRCRKEDIPSPGWECSQAPTCASVAARPPPPSPQRSLGRRSGIGALSCAMQHAGNALHAGREPVPRVALQRDGNSARQPQLTSLRSSSRGTHHGPAPFVSAMITNRQNPPLVGSPATLAAIESGEHPRKIARNWQPSLSSFPALRSRLFLYPSGREARAPWATRSSPPGLRFRCCSGSTSR